MAKNSSSSSSSGGIGFLGALTILFIALKLTGVIAWSWFWVLSPMIFGFGLVILIIAFSVAAMLWLASAHKSDIKNRNR